MIKKFSIKPYIMCQLCKRYTEFNFNNYYNYYYEGNPDNLDKDNLDEDNEVGQSKNEEITNILLMLAK
jgi:hypothetical protein